MNRNRFKEVLVHGTLAFPVAVYNNFFDSNIDILAPLHYHDEFEFFLVTKGAISVQLEEQSYLLHEGEGIFINSGLLHVIRGADECKHAFIAIVFHPTLIGAEQETVYLKYLHPLIEQKIIVHPEIPAEICKQILQISSIYKKADFAYELAVKQQLTAMLYMLIKDARHDFQPATNSKSQLIKMVLDYIKENYSQEITLQNLADSAHISREYLCRIFQDMSDTSPIVYLNRYRITQSTELLIHTNKNISDIASLCGFNNSSYFNKLFLRYIGCTPKQYRTNYF